MSQSEPDTTFSPGRGQAAMSLFQLHQGQRGPLEFAATQGLVQFNAALHDLDIEIADAKADADANNEQEAFLALPPSNDTFDNDNVFSVGAESQFSDSTPPTPPKNLRTQLGELRILMDTLKSSIPANGESFFEYLNHKFTGYPQIQIYGNHHIVAGIGQNMLVPMLSFYGITTKDGVASIKPNIGEITTDIESMVARIFIPPPKVGLDPSTAQQAVGFEELSVDCPMPTATNLCWNVRLTLNGNIFTLLTFRIVAMTIVNVELQQSPLSAQNLYIHLLFALLSKACAKDFNCLCSMPEIDVELFKSIAEQPGQLEGLILFIRSFLENLAEPQLDSKRSYMLTALHNLVSSFDTSKTGETLAYKYLFDGETPGSGANTFNPIMTQINKVIRMLREASVGREELQVSLCGGRMIYKLGDVIRGYVTPGVAAALGPNAEFLFAEMVKPLSLPSDSDYTYSIAGISGEDPDFVQTRLMFYTFCSQLGIKKIIDDFCTSEPQHPDAAFFLKERVVVGMSLVGGDFQLSSSRNSCDALAFLDMINIRGDAVPTLLNEFLRQFPRDLNRVPKSSLAPCDLVPKMPSGNYIKKIAVDYIFVSGYVDISPVGLVMIRIVPNIDTIANIISRYSMSTDQGFSSPIKVLFDIFFTLFSIENFTNRAFVTQKINKELKRIAICASILFFHFNELLPGYAVGTEQHTQITTMLEILGRVINYGYNPTFKLLSAEIDNIMTAYASCFVQLLQLYSLGVVFYSRVPGVTLPPIGGRSVLYSLETRCMDMLRVYAPVVQDLVPRQALAPYQNGGLSDEALRSILPTGLQFLYAIQGNGILQNFLQLKQKVKTKDSEYKAEGKFLTSVEAFEFFLQGFPEIEQPFPEPALPGFVTILTHSTLLNDLQPLLNIFHSDPGFAELMHFEPIVVIKSENLTDAAKANPANAEGLKVSGQHQFGIYALLSIFGVKFKSEWSKIALFTRMLFRELFSRGMNDACQSLLGVDLGDIDPAKYRTSYENYEKDVILFRVLQRLGIAIESLPSLSTYYGRGNVHHGVNVYFNPVTAAINFQFIFPDNPQPNDELLSFQFLSPEILQRLGVDAFGKLLAQGALQPRAYEFLVDRLLQKFSNLTKECDESVTKELIKASGHSGKPSKDIKVQRKLGEVDAFIQSLIPPLSQQQQPNGSNEFISQLMASPLSACFEGKKDADKFVMLSDEQRMQWHEHLTSMIRFLITFLITYSNTDPIHQRLVKYSKLLLLLKKYISPPPQATMQQAAMQQAAIQEAAMQASQQAAMQQQAAIQEAAMEAARQAAAIEEAARQAAIQEAAMQQQAAMQASRQAAPASSAKGKKSTKSGAVNRQQSSQGAAAAAVAAAFSSFSGKSVKRKDKGQGGGSPKASASKSKPKTRNNNRYSKNTHTRKNKHKHKQHRNRKYKKTTNTKSNRRTKSQSKKNVTFKRRRR